ncbi:MAG: phosphoglucosamine mutase [Christensenellaceae bacterium]
MNQYFGTDGFRGVAGRTILPVHAYRLGLFLGAISKEKGVLVGKDPRISSDLFVSSLSAGVMAAGGRVASLGVVTTPCLAYLTKKLAFAYGAMITASHNPYTDNGIKIFDGFGEKADDHLLQRAEGCLEGDLPPVVSGSRFGRRERVDGREAYLAHLMRSASRSACRSGEGISLQGKKIALDTANGSTALFARSVFERLGAEAVVIADRPNGINVNEGCGSTCPETLSEFAKRERADFGFAFDGDGDRCVAVDGKGRVADGDSLLFFLSERLRPRSVVLTKMSNYGLVDALRRRGIAVYLTEVGDRAVRRLMKETGASLGGEPSGHVIFGDDPTGDGLKTAIILSILWAEEERTDFSAFDGIGLFKRAIETVRIDRKGVLESESVQAAIERAKEVSGGRLFVRSSGTEPVIRILAEGEDEARQREAAEIVAEAVRRICAES